MEVVLIYANWCGHCQKLLENIDKYKSLIKSNGLIFTMIESSNTKLISQYEDKYNFKTQYFPFLFIIKDSSIEELTTNFNDLQIQLKKYSKQKETFSNNNNKIVVVFTNSNNDNEISIIEKYRKLSIKNNYYFKVIVLKYLNKSFFIIFDDTDKIRSILSKLSNLSYNSDITLYLSNLIKDHKRYYFNREGLLKLYTIIINTNKNMGSSFIPQFLINLLNPNYDTQSKLNNNRVVKCKISKNGNIDNIDCQTIY